LDDKPKISFVSAWHTPVAQCVDYKMRLAVPESTDTIKNIKQWSEALALYSLFQPLVYRNINNKFSGSPISYSDIVTKDLVAAKYTFSFANMTGMAIIGPSDKMPSQIREEIDRIRPR
jgi:hypothetical protein